MAVFCGNKLSKKCTHLRPRERKLSAQDIKTVLHHPPRDHQWGWIAKYISELQSDDRPYLFPISPMMEIVPLLSDHLKSKVLTFKTSKTCSTSLTLKENRQKYGQIRTVMSIRNHWYLILIYKWITQLPISACCMFMEPRPTYMCYIKRLNLSI